MKTLNVGCGDSREGTHFIDLYPRRKEVIKCDINKDPFPFGDDEFSSIIAENILEHLTNVGWFMAECRRVLKPWGELQILTDNAGYWLYHNERSTAKVHSRGYEQKGKGDKHFMLFTPHHIKNYLSDNNFTVSGIWYYDDFNSVSVWIRLIQGLMKMTRFGQMAFPKIKAVGIKKADREEHAK